MVTGALTSSPTIRQSRHVRVRRTRIDRPSQEGEGTVLAKDARLRQGLEDALSHADYPDLRKVHVETDHGTAVLTGKLPSYFLKQLAQVTAQEAGGSLKVVNDITVVYPESSAAH